jgi:hypothetical protein
VPEHRLDLVHAVPSAEPFDVGRGRGLQLEQPMDLFVAGGRRQLGGGVFVPILGFGPVGEAFEHDLPRAPVRGKLRFLGKVGDLGAAPARDRADVGRFEPREDPKERALAGSVDADDTDALARPDRERNGVEHGVRTEGFREILTGENGHEARRNLTSFRPL